MNDIKLRILGYLFSCKEPQTSYSVAKCLDMQVQQVEYHLDKLVDMSILNKKMIQTEGKEKKVYLLDGKKAIAHSGLVFSFVEGGPLIIHCKYFDKCIDRNKCGSSTGCLLYKNSKVFRVLFSD